MDRQAYVIKIAQELISNSKIPTRYKIKLQHTITMNKLKYVKNAMRKIDTPSGKAYKRVLGTADVNSKVIRITSFCWEAHHSDMRLVDYQIKHTLVHEADHLLSGNTLHPKGLKAFSARITALLGGR